MKVISDIRKAYRRSEERRLQRKKKKGRKSFYLEIRIQSTKIRHVASRLFPGNLEGN